MSVVIRKSGDHYKDKGSEFPTRPRIGEIIDYLEDNGFEEIDDYISLRGKLLRGLKSGERYYMVGKNPDGDKFVKFWTSRYGKYTIEHFLPFGDNPIEYNMYIKFFDDPMDYRTRYGLYGDFRKDAIENIRNG